MKLTRHVGLDKATNARVILLHPLLDGTQDCLITYADNLPSELKEAVFQVQNADEGQRAINLMDVLGRRVFSDSQRSILEILHVQGYIKKVSIDNVIMTPSTIYKIPLRDVLVQSKLMPASVSAITAEAGKEKFNPHIYNASAANRGEAVGIARNLLAEATMLEEAAKKKREEAYSFAPSLHPMNAEATSPYQVPDDVGTATPPLTPYVIPDVGDHSDENKIA